MIYQTFKKKQNGFTLIEMLVTLMILSLCSLLFAKVASIMVRMDLTDERVSDEIAIFQMQLIFAQATNLQVGKNHVTMRYHGEDVRVEMYADKLVKRPGFEVLLQHVDELSFNQDNNCISLKWKRGNRDEEAKLLCE